MITKIQNNDITAALKDEFAVIDFSAPWCGPCNMLAPVFDELSEEMADVHFYNINTDENQKLAFQFEVTSIPFLMAVKNGEVVGKAVGFRPKEQIKEWIESLK